MGPSFRFGKIASNFLISWTAFKGEPKLWWDLKVRIKFFWGIIEVRKTVLVLPRHSPKSGVRNEKNFFWLLFKFFLGSGLEALLPRYLSRYPHLYNYSRKGQSPTTEACSPPTFDDPYYQYIIYCNYNFFNQSFQLKVTLDVFWTIKFTVVIFVLKVGRPGFDFWPSQAKRL